MQRKVSERPLNNDSKCNPSPKNDTPSTASWILIYFDVWSSEIDSGCPTFVSPDFSVLQWPRPLPWLSNVVSTSTLLVVVSSTLIWMLLPLLKGFLPKINDGWKKITQHGVTHIFKGHCLLLSSRFRCLQPEYPSTRPACWEYSLMSREYRSYVSDAPDDKRESG